MSDMTFTSSQFSQCTFSDTAFVQTKMLGCRLVECEIDVSVRRCKISQLEIVACKDTTWRSDGGAVLQQSKVNRSRLRLVGDFSWQLGSFVQSKIEADGEDVVSFSEVLFRDVSFSRRSSGGWFRFSGCKMLSCRLYGIRVFGIEQGMIGADTVGYVFVEKLIDSKGSPRPFFQEGRIIFVDSNISRVGPRIKAQLSATMEGLGDETILARFKADDRVWKP